MATSAAVAVADNRRIARSAAYPAALAMGLPTGRRSPRGGVRLYAARVPEGREGATAARLQRVVSRSVLAGALALRREKWERRAGAWSLTVKPLYPGYVFLQSGDAVALAQALERLTFSVELTGAVGRGWAPLSDEAAAWLEASVDARGVVRGSTGAVVDGELFVWDGPLAGREASVERVDRHHRAAIVRVGDGRGCFYERLALHVPFKGASAEYEAWLAREGAELARGAAGLTPGAAGFARGGVTS